MNTHKRFGFTLIEILIVVAIIGILASIALVGLRPAQVGARDARRIAELGQIRQLLELYAQSNNGEYPSAAGTVQDVLSGASLGKIPVDSRNGSGSNPALDYRYKPGQDNAGLYTGYLLYVELEGKLPSNVNFDLNPTQPNGAGYSVRCGRPSAGGGGSDVYCIAF